MAYEKQTGKMHPKMADAPELPASCIELWEDFIELHETRGDGPSRISFRDIEAFQSVRGYRMAGWQVDAIIQADRAFIASLPKPGGAS